MHPDYFSTGFATRLSNDLNVKLVPVQHHHAHIVSCMAEYGLDGNVIGISLDGTGYGTDGKIWGGEFLIADTGHFTRFTHFDYVSVPGGDIASDEPWRMAYSYLLKYFGPDFDFGSIPSLNKIDKEKKDLVKQMLIKGINSPLSSGAGRLFDAVSAILGLCTESSFDSEAPMRLESVINHNTDLYYPFEFDDTIGFSGTFRGILEDLPRLAISSISAKFHNTIAEIIVRVSVKIRKVIELNRVVLSGGVFQNKYLLEKSVTRLEAEGFKVYTNHLVPANDGGISLGQLVVASKISGLCA
jgi:hydrogenase maturation protein HypF